MTGAEFASKYTVLKPLDQRSVRSFVAQELSTRRAVMVHWLDQLSATDRTLVLSRLERLPPEARERLLNVETVDGAPVVVTRMILDFESLPKWLDKVAPAATATRPTPIAPPVPAPKSGGFTDLFMAPSAPPAPPSPAAPRGAPVAATDSPTVAWTPPSVKKPEPKSEPKPTPNPHISVRFREPSSAPKPAPPSAAPPAPKPPPPAAPAAPAAGEFTRIFGAARLEPEPPPPAIRSSEPAPLPPPPLPPMSGGASATSALARVSAPSPAPPPQPIIPPSASMPWSGPPPVDPLPPQRTPQSSPMPGANINLSPSAPVMPAQPVQSDFTRIIGAAHAPPSGPVPTPIPAAPPAPTPPPAAASKSAALPVLISLGALALSAVILVIYFILRR